MLAFWIVTPCDSNLFYLMNFSVWLKIDYLGWFGTRRYNPEDQHRHFHHSEKLKSQQYKYADSV
jgi:hypothetical protein